MATQDEIEVVSKALRAYFTKLAREAIDRIPFDPLETEEFIGKLLGESPTAQVLIFHSYFDDRFTNLLALQMLHLESNNAIERVFGVTGPLSTFNSRVLIAYHLGWIKEDIRNKLEALRKLRNAFAHRAFKLSMTDPEIVSYVAELERNNKKVYDDIKTGVASFNPNLLCSLVVIAFSTFYQLIIFPIARMLILSEPEKLLTGENEPELLKKVRDTMVRSVLTAGGVK
jgi:hypothetical protein